MLKSLTMNRHRASSSQTGSSRASGSRTSSWQAGSYRSILLLIVTFANAGFIPLLSSGGCIDSSRAMAASRTGGFSGIEFLGSSLISRVELEKIIRLGQGASLENADKALERMRVAFEKRALKANVEVVPDSDAYYICVDVLDSRNSNAIPTRQLEDMHHIRLPNERPFVLLQELQTRLEKLLQEGRPSSESYENGSRQYSDVAAMRIAEKLGQELEGQRPYLLKILSSDPNGERRGQAAELLNFCGDPVDNCFQLIAALDDIDVRVRKNAAKYIWARIRILPNKFPFDELVEALSRQLSRPSHHDRLRSMAALLELSKRDSDSITGIKTFDEARLKELQNTSVIPSIQKAAGQLVSICANPPPLQRPYRSKNPEDSTGF